MRLDARVSVLDNGVTVATSRIPEVQSASAGIWASVGGRYEPARLNGISHFLEHMVFKGTRTRSARRISRDVESRGGYLNAFTQAESTCFFGRVAAEHLGRVFSILADLYTRSRLAPKDVENERSVIAEELLMEHDQPEHHVHTLLDEQLWPDHPLGRNISGTEKTLRAFRPDVLRTFMERHYTGRNTTAAFAGAVDHETCVALARRYLGHLPAGRRNRFRPSGTGSIRPRVRLETRRIEQVHLALGFRVFGRRDPRRWTLLLLSTLLGGNMSSRLFQHIRERRGWAYSIHSSVQFLADTGVLNISAGLDSSRAERAIGVIMDQVRRLCDSRVSPTELRIARDYAVGQTRIALESSASRMLWLGETLTGYGRIRQPDEAIERLKRVTAADIQTVAQACLRRRRIAAALLAPEDPRAANLADKTKTVCKTLP